MPVEKQTLEIPLVGGLDTKSDPRSLRVPKLARCENAIFEEHGGIQKRRGYEALGSAIETGGTISNTRRIASRDDELVLFANKKTFSYSGAAGEWADRGSYEQCRLTTKPVVDETGNQYYGDVAFFGGVAVYGWTEGASGSSQVNIQVVDEASGTVLAKRNISTADNGGTNTSNVRCHTINGRLHVYYSLEGFSKLRLLIITPTDIAGTIASAHIDVATNLSQAPGISSYDVSDYDADEILVGYVNTSAQYTVLKVNHLGTVTATAAKARTAQLDGLSLDYSSAADRVAVLRETTTDIRVDILDGALADTAHINKVIETTASPRHYATVAWEPEDEGGGVYRAWAFVSTLVAASAIPNAVKVLTRYTDTNGAQGTATTIAFNGKVVGHAFGRGGHVYVLIGSEMPEAARLNQLQNTYFLMREDGYVVSRIFYGEGFNVSDLVNMRGIPKPKKLSGQDAYRIALTVRRRVDAEDQVYVFGGHSPQYADLSLYDALLDFDSDVPYTGVEVDQTLYLGGAHISQYDGDSVVESGFHLFPEDIISSGQSETGGGLSDAVYAYKVTYEWTNAQGQIERSTDEGGGKFDITPLAGDDNTITIRIPTFSFTNKKSPRRNIAIVVWRTLKNPGPGARFYRVSNPDPEQTGAAQNPYLQNSTTVNSLQFVDGMSDATAKTQELYYRNAGILDNVSTGSASYVAEGKRRLFSVDHSVLRYSKLYSATERLAIEPSDGLFKPVPGDGGDFAAIGFLDNTAFLFKETKIYALLGEGEDNAGLGEFQDPYIISHDVGCTEPRTLVATPVGLIFKSRRGFYVLGRGGDTSYIGAPVEDYNAQTFVSANLIEDRHHVRFLTSSGTTLLYDYLLGQWAEWTNHEGKAAVVVGGTYYYLHTSGVVRKQAATFADAGTGYSLLVETGWLPMREIIGYGRVRRVAVLGEYRTAHRLDVDVFYNGLVTSKQTITHTPSIKWDGTALNAGDPEALRFRTKIQKCQSVKVRIADKATDGGVPTDEGLKLTALAFEIGAKPGLYRQGTARTE